MQHTRPGTGRSRTAETRSGRLLDGLLVLVLVGGLVWAALYVGRSAANGWLNHEVRCTVVDAQLSRQSVPKGGETYFLPVETTDCGRIMFSSDHLDATELQGVERELQGGRGRVGRFSVGRFTVDHGDLDGLRFLGWA